MGTIRLAHLTHWPLPSNDTATTQLVQTAAALVRAGAEVDLVFPRRPGEARQLPDADLGTQLRTAYGIQAAFGLRGLPSRLPGPEWLAHLTHALLGSRFAARQRYDVVHTRDLETVPFALRLGCRVLFESHRPLTRRSRWHRRLLLRAATNPRFLGLVTHSRFIAAKYAADGIPAAKLRAIHNGYDPAPFATRHPPGEARALLGLAEQPTVVYAGRLAPLKRIDLLLEAAARSPEIQWVLAGASDTAEARPFIERGGLLPNVRFPGFLRGERLAFALQAADVLVLSPDRDAVRHPEQVGLPIKLFQYLAAGRPIVAPDVPDTAELLVHEQNSVRIPGAASLLGAVRELLSDPVRRDRLGAGALESARGCTWDARATALLAFLAERRAAREPVA